MEAFKAWAKETYGADVDACAAYLNGCVASGDTKAELVWKLIEETGDTVYNYETFVKAARALLDVSET